MKVEYLIGIIILLVVILLLVIHLTKEGFTTDQDLHDQYSKTNQKKYNNVGIALHVTDNDAALGSDTRGLLGSIRDTLDSSNNPIQTVESDYPVEGGTSGMSLVIKKCEAITPVLTIDDCKKLDDPSINTTCGICLADPSDMGTNSEGSQWAGGLVLTAKDRDEYRKQNISRYGAVNGFLPDYSPTVGSCPAGRMVSTRTECEKLQKELTCQKGGTLGSPSGCSQCYNDNTYHIVDPSAEAGLILGAGKIMVVGSGTVTWSETGQSNNGSFDLSPTILKPIPLMGGEYNPITLTLTAPAIPRPYDNSVTYRVNDLVIFNNAIFKMQEGAGVPGYSPDRPGDKLWLNRGAYSNYVAPPPTFIAGHLKAPDGGGDFQPIDLYRLILTDTITGRKPRVINQINVGGVDMTKMGAGFGQTRMNLTARSPFTFIDPLSQEATLCSNSPFVTQAQSSALLNSDPCYARGHNTPGTYSLECLQQVFQNNGCGLADGTVDKSGFPATNAKAAALMINSSGTARTMNEIIDTVYQAAVSTATGLDAAGNQLTLADWSKASLFCTGVAINSPCDANAISGPLSSDCIVYLWDNEGENKIAGATYSLSSLARSLFSSGRTDRFCTRNGSKAPKDLNDQENAVNMAYWKAKGGVAAVKAAMSDLHVAANTSLTNEDTKAPSILQCYGIVPDARPTYTSKYTGFSGPSKLSSNTILKSDITLPDGFDYTLSFDITPYGTISGNHSSIIRITNTTTQFLNKGDRNPMILFSPSTTVPYIVFGDDSSPNWWGSGDDPTSNYPALPLNQKTSISIKTTGKSVLVTVGSISKNYTQPTKRQFGTGYKLYASDNFFPAANAMIENINYSVNGSVVLQTPPAPPPSSGPGQSL